MFIKSMVIDGFKSYGTRTEITGFDHQFNAITGLNGSGKSNILDAICFLLGITNLSHVRASNLQELVYKNGQAGVTKATVSITFDNRDKKQSPLGYEQYDEVTITRQVVIGGKNKYLINGTNVQTNRVIDFFGSVQLNVNNPHFLIMQGRITKVLNMKPPEILSMIEEAAGTRMYEAKKKQAEKTIEKKDAKLNEINNILAEEINPTLTKLKDERSAYLEYQKIQRELEHLTKLYLAYKFVCAEQASHKTEEELNQVKLKMEEIENNIKEGDEEILRLDKEIEEITKLRDAEVSGELEHLEIQLKEKEKTKAKTTSHMKSLKENIKTEERKRKQVEKGLTEDRKALGTKEKTLGGMQNMFDALREEDEACQSALKQAQDRYQAISLGEFSSESGESATLQEQIINTKKEMSAAETEIKTADLKAKNNQEQLKKKQMEMKKTEAEYLRDSKNLGKFECEVQDLEKKLQKIDYEEGTAERMSNDQRQLKMEVNALKSQMEGMEARFPQLNFQYSDPERGFDRRAVRGVAAKLFSIKNDMFCQALNTAAGGKLYHVVIDSEQVGKQLLQKGNLQRRVTFIPLNKINPPVLAQGKITAAKKIGGKDNVWWARELISSEEHFKGVMNHLFGNVLICRDLNVAEKVAFNREVYTRCVTLDGDVVSPGGDMSGGSVQKGDCMLAYIFGLKDTEKQLREKQQQLAQLEHQLKSISGMAEQWNQMSQQLELRQHELDVIKKRLEQTLHYQLKEEVERLQEDSKRLKENVEQARVTVKEGTKKVKDLEYKITNAKEIKAKELKAADEEVKKCKVAAEKSQKKWSSKEQEEGSLKMELDGLKKSIESGEEQLENVAKAIQEWETEITQAQEEVTKAEEEVKEAEKMVKDQKDVLHKQNAEINSKTARKEQIAKKKSGKLLEIQEMGHAMKKAVDDKQEADRRVKHMLEDHEWIQNDRKLFGQPNTLYDFKVTDPNEAGKRIQKLEGTKEKLAKSVNMRAMNMLEKAEEQYSDLIKKKKIVETDKAKINETIKELDIKKKEALRKAWDQVNRDFGSIFSSILPGTSAKLQPPEGQDVLDGLEVRVAFGGVWKDSLTELSGGQRSLVALSLILSLLLFKPAPLYILDEVDAALDLSHTQNIGHMLKTHFKSSQFIVVSLKDGMFNNANVLFRTKFVDGMSTVSRTVQAQNSSASRK